jgi:putative aldouronate transport system substrate-binding protein
MRSRWLPRRNTSVKSITQKRKEGYMRTLSKWLVPFLFLGLAFELSAGGETGSGATYDYTIAATNSHRRDPDVNITKGWVDEYFDVNFEWVITENQLEKLNVLLAAGDTPDMMAFRLSASQLATYADQGVLAELPVSMIREHMPEYYAQQQGLTTNPLFWKYGEIDGRHMGLPTVRPGNMNRRGITWNGQWLANVGITEIPTTLDEFGEAFSRFRNQDPDGNGAKDTFGFTAGGDAGNAPEQFFEEIFGAHGTFAFKWIEKDGGLVYGFTDPGTKEALALLADWYDQEIIDPEWVTEIRRKDGANDISWKFANEKIGYVSSYGSDDSEWDGGGHLNRKFHTAHPELRKYIYNDPNCWPDNCQGQGHYEIIAFTEIDAAKHAGEYHPYVLGDPPVGPRGDAGMSVRGGAPVYTLFGRQLENDEDKFVRLLEILNEMATDRHVYYQAALGCFADQPETEWCADYPVWEWVPFDGGVGEKFQQTQAWLDDSRRADADLAGGFSTNPFWTLATWYNLARGGGGIQRQTLYDNHAQSHTVEDPMKVTLPSQAEYADVNKVLHEFFYKVILGTQSVDDYDDVVAQWRRNGGDVLTREANAWFDTVK